MTTNTFTYKCSCLPPLSLDNKVMKENVTLTWVGWMRKQTAKQTEGKAQEYVQSNPPHHHSAHYEHRCTIQFMLIMAISSQRKVIAFSFMVHTHVLQEFYYSTEGSTARNLAVPFVYVYKKSQGHQ